MKNYHDNWILKMCTVLKHEWMSLSCSGCGEFAINFPFGLLRTQMEEVLYVLSAV